MTLKDEVRQANEEFEEGNGKVVLEGDEVLATRDNGITYRFRVPSDEGRGQLPGWFWAGIWDYMGMPDLQKTLDVQMLEGGGWNFHQNGARYWTKYLSDEPADQLIFDKNTGRLMLKSPTSYLQELGIITGKSIFHLLRRFQEEGWFEPQESKIVNQGIVEYLVK